MKTTILIFSLLLTFTNCNDDDSTNKISSICNKWNLVKIEGGFSPTENFNIGEITWTFNSDNSLDVVVANGIEVSTRLPLNMNGSYTYSINDGELVLNDNQSFKYEIINNELIISTFIGVEADGFKASFSKVNQE